MVIFVHQFWNALLLTLTYSFLWYHIAGFLWLCSEESSF